MQLSKSSILARVITLVTGLSNKDYYGILELTYEKGRVVNIKKHDIIKPEEL